MISKKELDNLAEKFEVKEFTENDPSMFLRKFDKSQDIEIAAFISALFSFGKREQFIKKLHQIFLIMKNAPHNYVLNFKDNNTDFIDFKYRFIKGEDITNLIFCLNQVYKKNKSLKNLFQKGYDINGEIKEMLKFVTSEIYSFLPNIPSKGFKHLLPNPNNNSALKRYCLFLRWMVRKSNVDIGLWDFIDKADLIIPLDTHVLQQAKKMGLIKSPKPNFKTAVELTNRLKEYDSNDPIKYDFALFGYDINNY